MKVCNKKVIGFLAWTFLACSFSMLSFYQIIQYTKWNIIITVVLSFAGTFLFVKKTGKKNYIYVRRHPETIIIMFLISLNFVKVMYQVKGVTNIELRFQPLPFYFFRLPWWGITIPALCYLLIWSWRIISNFFCEFWKGLDEVHRKIYFLITIIFSSLVIMLYFVTPQWYLQYDIVYSIDSGWCYQYIFPDFFYYDIRHPVLNILVFPLWMIVHFILKIFVPEPFLEILCVSCVQIINIQFLLFIGFMIEKLSKSKIVLFLYLVSSPVLLFSFFFEKYQICTFLLVLYVYRRCEKKRNPEADLIFATGAMSTSFFLAVNEVFIRESWEEKVQRFCRIAIQGMLLLIFTGRVHLLNLKTLWGEVFYMAGGFGKTTFSVMECCASFINLVQGAFIGLSSAVIDNSKYLWTNILDDISGLGVVILIVIIIGIIKNKNDCFVKFCTAWSVFAVILFFCVQWSVHESPLFSIYFSWAFIPLFQKGLQSIIDKMKWKEMYFYTIIIISMFVVNVLTMIDIGLFLKRVVIGEIW